MILFSILALAATPIPSTPRLGTVEARCRPNEPGPALIVDVDGLKDRVGVLRAELYPARDGDFLADDNVLIGAGKTFRRSVITVPASGVVSLCLRVPAPGTYALSVVHARDGGHGFSLLHDGIGFASNPKLGHSKPHADQAKVVVHDGITTTHVVMNYRSGLFSFAPIKQ
ncbi:uncharacterized protein (DUF2141 family) [Sphingomonas sp. PP-CE-3A-406]|uniref:DUF2141 domain-containing protein n=1 Tax=Sphingomonas sp. PP-CE-3A-406 TaxID=2135659 RepID=UPI000F1676FD|nr:uncharacterized protein (DUF2141 family) [Sphingomonas sp. PP-CE-3A-406]